MLSRDNRLMLLTFGRSYPRQYYQKQSSVQWRSTIYRNRTFVTSFFRLHSTVNCFANRAPVAVRAAEDEKPVSDLISWAIHSSLLFT